MDVDALRLETEMMTRANTDTCRRKIKDTAQFLRHGFRRHFPRHEFAERSCPVNVLEGSNGQVAEDGNNIMYTPDPPSVPLRAPGLRPGDPTHAVCSSVIVFAVLLSVGDSVHQVERLLSRLLHKEHYYHFSIDVTHDRAQLDVLTAALHAAVKTYGPVRGYTVANDVDVVYSGSSMMRAYMFAWRDALAKWGSTWDFLINLSAADYPLVSVPFMARYLAHHGAVSYTGSWYQSPNFAVARACDDWLVECSSEERDGRRAGYVFRLNSQAKPPLTGVQMYGGSAFSVLHRGFVNYTWGCSAAYFESKFYASPTLRAVQTPKDPYCASIHGMLEYFSTAFCPEEMFVQTALLNGPYCNTKAGPDAGNQRWESWDIDAGDTFGAQFGSDFHTNRPGAIHAEAARDIATASAPSAVCASGRSSVDCANKFHALMVRKLKLAQHPEAYDVLDGVIKQWADELDVVFPCSADGLHRAPEKDRDP